MIDWMAFVTVVLVAAGSACVIVFLFSAGLRLIDGAGRARRVLGRAAFVACAMVVLVGIVLIVPAFSRALLPG